jgi:anti-sigma factor RsiW
MAMTCKDVWREVSDYIDDTISPEMRHELELHLSYCRHCTAIIDGVRNIVILVADGRLFSLPSGFSARLQARLNKELFPHDTSS